MKMLKPGGRSRLAALLLVLLSSSATQPANASNDVGQNIAFTLRCLGLALSDPEQHVAVCDPVMPPPRMDSIFSMNDSAVPPAVVVPPVVVPPPPPPPPPPDEEDDDDCPDGMFKSDCGGCYYAS